MSRSSSRTRLGVLAVVIAVLGSLLGMGPAAAGSLVDEYSISDDTKVEGDSGSTTFTFTVTRTVGGVESSTIAFSTRNGTATAGEDYASTSGTVTFGAGEATKVITVEVFADSTGEAHETFFVDIDPVDEQDKCSKCTGTGTIQNDDDSYAISDVAAAEGDTGTTFTFTVTRTPPTDAQSSTVTFSTRNGTAVAGEDYESKSGTLTFATGDDSETISITVLGDTAGEPDETFFVDIDPADPAATCSKCTGTGTIQNDDGTPPAIVISNAVVTEPDTGTVAATFNVDLTEPSTETITVDYRTADGTATVADGDYAAKNGTLTFAPGTTRQTVTIDVNGDTKDEENETFSVLLENAANATIQDAQGDGRIDDNDAAPTVSIRDLTVSETGGTASVAVELSAPSGKQVTVNYSTVDGSATAGADYTGVTGGTVTFAPGATTATAPVAISDDTADEPDETFTVTLSGPVNATIGDGGALVTITDDDGQPTIAIGDETVAEGDSGTADATFTVTLSRASGNTVTVDYATADGTATTADGDYVGETGTITFLPGDTSKTIVVAVNGDARDESDETFVVNLATPTNATITDAQGVATITDDDATPTLSIDDVTKNEGDTGTTDFTFTVTLSAASGQQVTVDYATADGTAKSTSDYVTTSGTLTFAPGELTKTISVPVNGDTVSEADETFTVNLTNPANAGVADAQGVGTITNDDAGPVVAITDVTIEPEGDTGTVTAIFQVTLSTASAQQITVDYTTADRTATAPEDYATQSGTLTFAPGQTSKSIAVTVNGDTIPEADETFAVLLSNLTGGATFGDPEAIGTIKNDDGTPPSLAIDDVTKVEGDTGTTAFTFTVTRTGSSTGTVTVDYATNPGTATTPGDFADTTGTLTFEPGVTSQTITVGVVGDTTNEPTETFTVDLSNPRNATVSDNRGIGTITNDDPVPTITVNDVTKAEGDSTTTPFTFTLSLSNPSSGAVTVDVATALGTAQSNDFTAVPKTTVTFAAGETTKDVTVDVIADSLDEIDETFFLDLSNASGGTIGDSRGIGTITDDDAAPGVTINDTSVTEGDTATSDAVFTVSLSAQSGKTISVKISTADGTAVAPGDYTAKTEVLTFAPGETTKTFTVSVNGDTTREADETFTATLSEATNVSSTGSAGTATIKNDDAVPTISVNDVSVVEGDSGTTPLTFTLTLSNPSSSAVTVDVATSQGTAADNDFTAVPTTTVTFEPGTTTKTVSVDVAGDTRPEGDETFFLDLTNASGGTIADNQGTGTINTDDALPSISVSDATVTEGDAGTRNMTFTLSLSSESGQTVTVQAATANGTATAGSDYVAKTETITFAPGETTKPFSIVVNGDTASEPDEVVTVDLTAPTNATIEDGTGTGTITDDDLVTISINDTSVTEGDSGTKNITFTVTLSDESGRTVTVEASTGNGTATAGSDYVAKTETLTFAPGETTKPFSVTVNGDTAEEATERFAVTLTSPANAAIGDGTGTGTIIDDDDPPATTTTTAPTTTTTQPPGGDGGGGSGAQGYSLVGEDGSLYAFGTAKNLGDMRGTKLNAPIIGVAYTPGGNGYWLVAKDGGIFTFGNAEFHGSTGSLTLAAPVIGMAATPSGRGYWLFASDGGIFTFGDAEFFGSMGGTKLNAPVINMEPLESGNGYWLVAADGGIFTFGQAQFFGSMGDQKLNQPVFDMTSTDTDGGYWLVARDGGIFSFGDAGPKFYGSAVNENPRPTKIIGMDSTPGSLGYWIADANGKVYEYGNADDLGDRFGQNNPAPMISFASVPGLKL